MAKKSKARKRKKTINAAVSVAELKDTLVKGREVTIIGGKIAMTCFVTELDVRVSESGLRQVSIQLAGTRAPRRVKKSHRR